MTTSDTPVSNLIINRLSQEAFNNIVDPSDTELWLTPDETLYRSIGEIVQSTIPLTDSGLHLLDGSLLAYGSYKAFIDYIADLYDSGDYTAIFDTEANWQTAVTTYGVCGKFVYDSVNKTVRLPKITGFTEGTITPSTLGNLTQAGLPNITGGQGAAGSGIFYPNDSGNGAFYTSGTYSYFAAGAAGDGRTELHIDASRSNPIYGNSNTVQPQSIKVLYYIVIASATKTNIQVDIDEIATDLNGKADVDLTNVNANGKNLITVQCMPNWKSRQAGVTALDAWKTVTVNSWVSIMTLTTAANRTLWIELKDENGNTIDGATDNNGIMRAQQANANCCNQVFAYVPKGYSYKGKIDSDQTFYSSYEYPLKGAN